MSATIESRVRPELQTAAILDDLESTRSGFRTYLAGMAGGLAIVAAGGVGAALVLLDWWLVLPMAVRAIGLLLLAGSFVAAMIRPLLRFGRLRKGDAATAIERAFPDMGQRLTTSLDYLEPTPETVPATPTLVEALVVDTDRRTKKLELGRLVPWGRLVLVAAAILLGLAVTLISLAASAELRIATARLFLLPAHYSQIAVKPGDQQLKAGEHLKVDVAVTGRAVHQLELRYRPSTGSEDWTTVALGTTPPPVDENTPPTPPEPIRGNIAATVRDCQRDFDYKIVSGEIASATYHVRVIHPLVLKEAKATVTPPAYTKRKPVTQPQGSLRVIEGSRVQLEFTLDAAPARAKLVATRKGERQPLHESRDLAISATKLTSEWPAVTSDVEYRLVAESVDGLKLESPPFRIRVQPDEKPTVKFVDPPEQIEATPTTEVSLEVKSSDDFGVAKVGIVFQIGDGPRETLLLEDFPNGLPTAEALARLYLEKHKLTFTDAITYFAFVEDNRPGKPHKVTSDLRFIDIRPYQRDFELLEGSGSCKACNGCSTSLEELIVRQRLNLNRSFAQLDRPQVDEAAAARLTKAEEELAAATGEFADGLAERFGEVPSLTEAVEAMQAAVKQLQAKTIPTAVESQEKALAGLVRSRQNLRKLLKEQSQSQCEECRKFDQQQQQKLRPPKKKEDDPVQLGDDVERLAKKQRTFSEDLASKPSSIQMQQDSKSKKPSKSNSSSSSSQSQSQSQSEEQPKEPEESNEPEMLKNRQQESQEKAEDLERRVRQDEGLTKLAEERMKAGTDSIRESAEALQQGDEERSAEAAKKAAEQLEELAKQIAGLKTPDLSARVGKARDLAQELAQKEAELGRKLQSDKPGKSGDKTSDEDVNDENPNPKSKIQNPKSDTADAEAQRKLAEQGKTLSDLLDRLRNDAADENRELGRSLSQAADRNPPEEAAAQMEQAAAHLEQGDRPSAAREATEAAARLADLAKDLDAAHRGLVREALDELLAAEKQAAEAKQALTSAKSESDKAAAETKLEQLQQSLDRLPQPGQAVAAAAQELADAQQAGTNWPDDRDPRGNYVPPQKHLNGLTRAIQALQARIQDLILKDALLDRDAPVPPEYQKLVEEYYKALSEDLR